MSHRAYRRSGFAVTLLLALLAGLTPAAVSAEPTIRRDGDRVVVTTDRFVATLQHGALVGLHSKLTDETFADPSDTWTREMATYVHGVGVTRVEGADVFAELKRLHQWYGGYDTSLPLATQLHPHAGSQMTIEPIDEASARVTWRGLRGFAPNRNLADATYTLELAVLDGSGDLQITPSARVGQPGVFGCSLLMANFSTALRVVTAEGPGVSFMATEPQPGSATTMRWPSPWHASLLIGESSRGSFGVWMADPTLGDRQLHRRHRENGWDVTFQSTNAAPFDTLTSSQGRPIRVNVHAGNWTRPAAAFRAWWASTHHVKPLAERKPTWLADLAMLARSGDTLPPPAAMPRTLVFAPQDWKRQPTTGDIGLFPYDMQGPDLNSLAGKIDEIRRHDGRLMVYFNITDMNEGHPLAPRFWNQRIIYPFDDPKDPRDPVVGSPSSFYVHPAYVAWQDLQLEWAQRAFDRFGIAGVYWDVAGGRPQNSTLGLVAGKNPNQGQVELMRRWSAANPGASFGAVEYLNEVTAIAADIGFHGYDTWTFAGGQRIREQQAHPIVAFLFGPFTQLTWYNRNESATLNEVLGRLPVWGETFEPAEEWTSDRSATRDTSSSLIALRLAERLTPDYPDAWDRDVRAYYRDASGRRYEVRARSPLDSELVRVEPDGSREVLYRRASGRESIEVPAGRAIEGWVAYAGDVAIGLDPQKTYFVSDAKRIDDWRVVALPAGVRIGHTRAHDDRLILRLDTADGTAVRGQLVVETPHAVKHVVTNAGVVAAAAGSRQVIDVVAPGVVALMCDDPDPLPLSAGRPLPLREVPRSVAAWNEAGLRVPFRHAAAVGGEGESLVVTVPWLRRMSLDHFVSLPSVNAGQKLRLDLGTLSFGNIGNAVTARVVVNGQVVAEHGFMRVPSSEMPAADLTAFAGQRVLLTIDLDNAYMKTPLTMSGAVLRLEE
jgi:hypothetical protein